MKIKNKEFLENIIDGNVRSLEGRSVLGYAYLWANTMEEEISKGKELKDIVHVTSMSTAHIIPVSRAQLDCAASILIDHWEHGGELNYVLNLSINRIGGDPFDK